MAETTGSSEVREERKPHRSADGPRGKDGAKPEWSGGRFRRPRRKSCRFCADRVAAIDYKDFNRIRSFVTDRGKIIPSRMTGTCASHQRELTKAIKRARNIALLPFAGN
jgi:small subunit ribosomal protein S18